MDAALILKNGKFYRGDQVVPLEFGNKEQISLMSREIKRLEQFKTGLPVDVEITHTIHAQICFKCKCGESHIYFEQESDNQYDDEDDFDFTGINSTCRRCHRVYEISKDKDGLIAIIVKDVI